MNSNIEEHNKKISLGGSLRDYKRIVTENEKTIYVAHYLDGKFITASICEKLEKEETG